MSGSVSLPQQGYIAGCGAVPARSLSISWRYGEVFGGLDYPHDLSHDLSERTVYIPSTSLCCYNQQRAITPLDHGVLVAESLTKDSLFAAIQQRLSGMSNIINSIITRTKHFSPSTHERTHTHFHVVPTPTHYAICPVLSTARQAYDHLA
jgi:hypothetical protein